MDGGVSGVAGGGGVTSNVVRELEGGYLEWDDLDSLGRLLLATRGSPLATRRATRGDDLARDLAESRSPAEEPRSQDQEAAAAEAEAAKRSAGTRTGSGTCAA